MVILYCDTYFTMFLSLQCWTVCDVVWSPSPVQYFKRFERIHSKFCSLVPAILSILCIPWRNVEDFILLLLCIELFTSLPKKYFQLCYNYYLSCWENSHRLFVPRVRTRVHKSETHWMPHFMLRLLLDNLNSYTSLTLVNCICMLIRS